MKILILMLLLASVADGEVPCSDVNLTLEKKWGKAAFLITGKETRWDFYLKQMPLYDQGKTGICYSYAAVQLVDYWRQTMGIRVTKEIMLSSPLYASLLSRINKKSPNFGQKTLEGGDITDSINSIRELGMCREDVIQESLNTFANNRGLDQREFLEIMELIFSRFPGSPEVIQNMPEREIWKKYIKDKFSFYDGRKINDDGNLAKMFKKAAPFIKNGDLTQFMNQLFSECQRPTSIYVGTRRIPIASEVVVRDYNQDALSDFIRNLLREKNAQPVGIGYCSKILEKKNYLGRFPDPKNDMQMIAKDPEECGSHASIVIGMKNIEGKCHYLVRNSWGRKCDYDWTCRFNSDQEAVGIWVEESALLNNLGEIAYLRNKDLVCIAKTSLGEDFFEMDNPSYPINDKNFIDIFKGAELIVVRADQDRKIRFLYGKDNKSLYLAREIDENKLKIPINIRFEIPKRGISLKMGCIPNGPNRTKLEDQLKKLINTQI